MKMLAKIGMGLSTAAAAFMPVLASAQSSDFGTGAILPSGTIDDFIDAVVNVAWPAILGTLFQPQLVYFYVAILTIGAVFGVIYFVVRRMRHPGR